jgi:hypothetical protein
LRHEVSYDYSRSNSAKLSIFLFNLNKLAIQRETRSSFFSSFIPQSFELRFSTLDGFEALSLYKSFSKLNESFFSAHCSRSFVQR